MNYEFLKFHVYEHYENNPHDIQYEQYQDQVLLSPLQQQTLIAACAGNASSWQLKTLSRQLNRSE